MPEASNTAANTIMDINYTRTRTQIPRRKNDLYSRARLISALNELLDKKMILVTAPAGYGKTSLLVDFASSSEVPVAWFSVDELDVEPIRFISGMISAVSRCFPSFGSRSMAVLQSVGNAPPDVDYLATVIANDLYDSIREHYVVVLDDYHLVNESAQINQFTSQLIQNLEENCHLILASRTLLSLPALPLMVARAEVGGLSFEEMAFSNDEIKGLFLQNNQRLIDDQMVEDIIARTEGWITGILLTAQVDPQAIENRQRINRASGVGLDEYFLEILNMQPADVREFVLRSSLLQAFNAERCRDVLGSLSEKPMRAWHALIKRVAGGNLFAQPVGDGGNWLRYHHLFSEFLRARMALEEPDITDHIERKLAAHFRQQGDWEAAYTIYHRLNMQAELVDLIEHAGPLLSSSGKLATLTTWLENLPAEVITRRPNLVSLQGNIAAMSGDSMLALSLYEQALQGMSQPEDREVMARTLARRASLHRIMGNLVAAIEDAQEALGMVKTDRDLRLIKCECERTIGICHIRQGKLRDSLVWLDNALRTARLAANDRYEAMVRMEIGNVNEALGNYDLAVEQNRLALAYWLENNNPVWLANLYNNLGVLQHIQGEYQSALESLEHSLRHSTATDHRRLQAFAMAGIGDIYDEVDASDEAMHAYQTAAVMAEESHENFLRVYLLLKQAGLETARGEFDPAAHRISQAREIALGDNSPLEGYLCDLEFAAMKLRRKAATDIIDKLHEAYQFFVAEGHQALIGKSLLLLVLADHQTGKEEDKVQHLLDLQAAIKADPHVNALLAYAHRFLENLNHLEKGNQTALPVAELRSAINAHQARIPTLRRALRQRAVSVPFAPPKIHIRSFGKLQAHLGPRAITNTDWQTQYTRDLLYMLLAHPEGLTREEIGSVFWPEQSSQEVKFRFKNTVYRLRRALGKDVVNLEQDHYRFNYDLDYEYDVELFMEHYSRAQQASDRASKLAHYRQAVAVYKGGYASDISYTWAVTLREGFQQCYLSALLNMSQMHLELSEHELALGYCQRAIETDNWNEDGYRLALRIYAAMGNRAGLVRQYQRCCDVLQRDLNAEPSAQTQALYQELSRRT